MRYAIIEHYKVVNIVESDFGLPGLNMVPDDGTAEIGGGWDGTKFHKIVIPTPVPNEVSPRQIRQAMTATGLRSSVEATIAAADQDTKDWYEFATSFERYNPHVLAMASILNVSDNQLDQLWTLAYSL